MARGARFEVLDDERANTEDLDYIVLDIRPELLNQVYEKLRIWKLMQEQRDTPFPDALMTVHLYVDPHRQRHVGPQKPDGSPPEVTFPPSLLRDDIP